MYNPNNIPQQYIPFNIDSATSETEEEQRRATTRSLSAAAPTTSIITATPYKPQMANLNRLNYRLITRSIINRDGSYQNTSTSSDTLAADVMYDTLYIALPSFFTQAPNSKKSVSIIIARLFDITEQKELAGSIHSTLVQFDASADSYCCTANLLYSEPKRYIIADNKTIFEVWARDIQGNIYDLNPAKTRLILELLLEF